MSVVRITDAERRSIIATRPMSGGERTPQQREDNRRVFQAIKAKYGIPSNAKIRVEVDSKNNPDYCVLKNKETGLPYEDIYNRTGTPIKAPAWAEPSRVQIEKMAAAQMQASMVQKAVAAMPPPQPKAVPQYSARAGSINLEDALQLLRSEGDACDSFGTSMVVALGKVWVENGRLYFVA